MESFTPTQEPDEGYSEHPLNSSASSALPDISSALSSRSPAEFSTWMTSMLPKLTVQEKKHFAMLILNELPTTAIADIVMTHLNPRLYINFVNYLPPEICLKILGYLDAPSLIRVALCCREWWGLAADQKLWEKLYRLEGWKPVIPEITQAEKRKNEASVTSQSHSQTMNGSHISRKRAISDSSIREVGQDEEDSVMLDADTTVSQEQKDTYMPDASLFGGSSARGSGISAQSYRPLGARGGLTKFPSLILPSKNESDPRSSKDKELSVAESLAVDSPSAETDSNGSTLPKSTLWIYDWRDRRYRISWKYLYSMRRKLESNWDRGRFINFQLPHPNHPEEGHNECIYSLQYNADYLVSGSRDRTLRIWNLHSKRLVRPPLTGHHGSVLCLQFDSDPAEDLIVSGSSDSDVILWRFSTGVIMKRLQRAHRESVLNVKFDKRILVTCSKDKTIKIFNRLPLRPGQMGYDADSEVISSVPINVRTYGYDDSPLDQLAIKRPYTMIACLEGHGAAVNAVQICGREIVSASGDRNIRLWDWPTQIVKRTFIGHSKGIACVQYDGRRIVSGSSDNEVKVFDCESGLEVASLRAHTNLVRTVQAGFGDLPYSRELDRLEARAIDRNYFRALNSGSLDAAGSNRRRARNAGSRRPEDITAYGAKLPPGGGGGPYGRIVSGSYDHSIIIWRRDREGAWKSAHVLRQEEASAAALRQTSDTTRSSVPGQSSPGAAGGENMASHAVDHTMENQPAPQPASAPSTLPTPPVYTQVEHPIHATITPQTTASYTEMIDSAVPLGPAALNDVLTSFPTMLTYNSHIQSAIDREPSPVMRAQLRQVVSACLVRTQIAQNRIQESAQQALSTEASSSVAPDAGQTPAPPRPSQPMSLSQMLNGDPSEPSISIHPMSFITNPSSEQPAAIPHGLHSHQSHEIIAEQTLFEPLGQHMGLHGHSQSNPTLAHGENGQGQAHTLPLTFGQHHAPAPVDPQVHPHIAQTDTTPARIFKLQFDASRIICCSQVSTIVGWDFCNGEPELEEVARFFGTVE
ncbi:hypothetical protein GGR50DRAFT_219951 [Xylaria sp. CBS 124048]|nr:hypothetical protein GGR50DRAFT_219951 [Xylaria sp. CBS 124048]